MTGQVDPAIAYTNLTQDDWVMATPTPNPVTEKKCRVQFCPARMSFGVLSAPLTWACAKHAWPMGENAKKMVVWTDATSDDSTFVDGFDYILTVQFNRDVKARVLGRFDYAGSGDTRLRFNGAPGCYVEVRPDHILDVVAV